MSVPFFCFPPGAIDVIAKGIRFILIEMNHNLLTLQP